MALDLRTDQLEKHWQSNDKKGRLNYILNTMDGIESWTVDEEQSIMEVLIQMATAFENSLNLKNIFEDNKDTILYIMAYISSSRAIRLFEWLDKSSKYKDFADNLIDFATENVSDPVCAIFLERLSVFKKANLLYQIFSAERIEKIATVLSKNIVE